MSLSRISHKSQQGDQHARRIVHRPTGLPACLKRLDEGHTAIFEHRIKVRPNGRLVVGLVVFEHPRQLHRFWVKGLGLDHLGSKCVGAVNSLMVVREQPDGRTVVEVDPVCAAVIGLVRSRLSMEVICHEAVHAGFAYAARSSGKQHWPNALEVDEEIVCYPAGVIAREINHLLWKHKVYPET